MELIIMLAIIAALLVMVCGGLIMPAKKAPVAVRHGFDAQQSGWELL